MPRGKAKSKWDDNKGCKHEKSGWCRLSSCNRCSDRVPVIKAFTKTVRDGFSCMSAL